MVGKIKWLRPKLHREAVKLPGTTGTTTGPHGPEAPLPDPGARLSGPEAPLPGPEAPLPGGAPQVEPNFQFPSRIFAGTTISPQTLVQTLTLEPGPRLPASGSKEPEERRKTKKEKMKERRERWIHTIDSIVRTKERQRAAAVRRATPVVGDLRPLADALPELSQLTSSTPSPAPASRRRNRKAVPVKRTTPTDYSRMNNTLKRKLLETERCRFSDSVKLLKSTHNALLDVGEQLRKRMRQEEEQQPP